MSIVKIVTNIILIVSALIVDGFAYPLDELKSSKMTLTDMALSQKLCFTG